MSIERDLHDLLYCHDCVIVPQWGGFLTHYRSARLDESNQVIHPPGKDISFNKNLDRNDGLLADHVAKREGKPFREAQLMIDDAVREWRRTLENNGRLELAHIGIFYRDEESNLQFDPDRRSNFLKDAFGLRPVAAVPVITEKVPVIRQMPRELPQKDVVVSVEKRTTIMWAAAAGAAVVFGAAAIWAFRMGDADGVQWSSLDPFGDAIHRTHVPPPDAPAPVVEPARFELPGEPLGVRAVPLTTDGIVNMTVDLGLPAPEIVPETTAVASPAKAKKEAGRARFHIIGGCFAQEENAERFLQELKEKGFDAQRLSRHGELHPVAFGSFTRRDEALQALASLKEQGTTAAWLLVR